MFTYTWWNDLHKLYTHCTVAYSRDQCKTIPYSNCLSIYLHIGKKQK